MTFVHQVRDGRAEVRILGTQAKALQPGPQPTRPCLHSLCLRFTPLPASRMVLTWLEAQGLLPVCGPSLQDHLCQWLGGSPSLASPGTLGLQGAMERAVPLSYWGSTLGP
ncbi:unnamed protein product [Rangifer tarandus platyrhynchus]|uniref:Uncharacterized protein n=2 Tax=Rangifer tarandus platyrhynchus TaxID=3082113 RepID=A0ACB0FPQ3_RANTA|nr:unnamed protein product [Rangifer tarandus platyrhynchus]CAI9714331.1 unnamed protein product [Rangifer tarandus platyrhynchus]